MTPTIIWGRSDGTLKVKLVCVPCGEASLVQIKMFRIATLCDRLDHQDVVVPHNHATIGFLPEKKRKKKK
jgi:hypothetical protein